MAQKKQHILKEKGFTLIEVVIVLAIGALIILVVIQAIGAARRSQRDSARKQEGARVAALLEQMASNDPAGAYPANFGALDAALVASYDPALGNQYGFAAYSAACPAPLPGMYQMRYTRIGPKQYQLLVCLEAGVSADYSL